MGGAATVGRALVAPDQEQLHAVGLENDAEMRGIRACRHHRLQLPGVEEIDTVVTTERPALDLEPVVVGGWIAFLGIDDEGFLAAGKLAVREKIDP